MHHAAAWGKLDVIKALVEGHADMQLRTIHGERPREIAIRYHQNAVTEFLEWAGNSEDSVGNCILDFFMIIHSIYIL